MEKGYSYAFLQESAEKLRAEEFLKTEQGQSLNSRKSAFPRKIVIMSNPTSESKLTRGY